MNRFHLHIGVADIDASVRFYENLFGAPPTLRRHDYAKWLLDDPAINIALSSGERGIQMGVDHVGLQTDSPAVLAALAGRLAGGDAPTEAEPDVTCCYARSEKTWTEDPDGLRWETFMTHEEGVEDSDRCN